MNGFANPRTRIKESEYYQEEALDPLVKRTDIDMQGEAEYEEEKDG